MKSTKTFRCKLVRFVNGAAEYMSYLGPFGAWASDWHMVMRRAG